MLINIYHTNDIHSNYEFLKKLDSYMSKEKKDSDFYFDSGDYCDLSSLIVQADKGISSMDLIMKCGLDLMAIGNNEIDLGSKALKDLIDKKYPLLSANLTYANDDEINTLMPSVILNKLGKRFLLIAVAPYYSMTMEAEKYNLFFKMGNLKTQEPISAIKKEIENNKGKYDYCILLSHSGSMVDENILSQIPEIDLCLGGHSHQIISAPGYSQSGRGDRLGRISLEVSDRGIKEIENIQIDLEDSDNFDFDRRFEEKEVFANKILNKEIKAYGDLDFNPLEESELINFVCDCLYKEYEGDLALIHSGIAEKSLIRPVSLKTLIETFPSKLNPTIFPISGSRLKAGIKKSLNPDFIRKSGKGAGFRGTILGNLGFSNNVRVWKDPFLVKIDGQEVDDNKEYILITDDYLQRGTGYKDFKIDNSKSRYFKGFIRDLVRKYLEDEEVFLSAKVQRIK